MTMTIGLEQDPRAQAVRNDNGPTYHFLPDYRRFASLMKCAVGSPRESIQRLIERPPVRLEHIGGRLVIELP